MTRKIRDFAVRMVPVFAALAAAAAFTAPLSTHQTVRLEGSSVVVAPATTDDKDVFPDPKPDGDVFPDPKPDEEVFPDPKPKAVHGYLTRQ